MRLDALRAYEGGGGGKDRIEHGAMWATFMVPLALEEIASARAEIGASRGNGTAHPPLAGPLPLIDAHGHLLAARDKRERRLERGFSGLEAARKLELSV